MELLLITLLFEIEAQKIVIAVALVILGALALFFLYSVAVLFLYWLIWLLPLLVLAGGIYLRFQEVVTGNVIIGVALVWALLWYMLIFSKRPNWLRRILGSLNRSLP
jgi:putative cofactor-binding repeat protein